MSNMKQVHIVGVGSTGSHIAYAIAKTRTRVCDELHVWDSDYVTTDNCRNQTYTPSFAKCNKVDAIAEQISVWAPDILVRRHCSHLMSGGQLSGVVFLSAGMSAHKRIVNGLAECGTVELVIETRIEATAALIHTFDPRNERHVDEWMRWWYPDNPETAPHGCGAATGEMPINLVTSSFAVTQLMRHVAIGDGATDALENQIRVYLRPLRVETYWW